MYTVCLTERKVNVSIYHVSVTIMHNVLSSQSVNAGLSPITKNTGSDLISSKCKQSFWVFNLRKSNDAKLKAYLLFTHIDIVLTLLELENYTILMSILHIHIAFT